MSLNNALLSELKHEAILTKKILERVPMEQKEWRPHAKSMTLGRLATHITETIGWVSTIRHTNPFDFLTRPFQPHTAASSEELLQLFQTALDTALNDLNAMTQEEFEQIWVVSRGEQVLYQVPKKVAIRGWAFSHQFHHRGQLSVYLRILDVPVPGMYGPSADER